MEHNKRSKLHLIRILSIAGPAMLWLSSGDAAANPLTPVVFDCSGNGNCDGNNNVGNNNGNVNGNGNVSTGGSPAAQVPPPVSGGFVTIVIDCSGNGNCNGNNNNGSGNGNQNGNGNSVSGGVSGPLNSLVVNPGSQVSMGGNVVHDVGEPILPTDAANKAYVDQGNTVLNRRIDKANEGVAIAMSLPTPIFHAGQTFVVQGGWGTFENKDAFGLTAAGLISRDTFGAGSTVTLSGGVGAGSTNNTVAGRAAVAIGW